MAMQGVSRRFYGGFMKASYRFKKIQNTSIVFFFILGNFTELLGDFRSGFVGFTKVFVGTRGF